MKSRVCVRERDVPDLNVLVAPLVEQLDAANLLGDVLGKDGVAGLALDLDFAVRHDCDVLGNDWFRRWVVVRVLSSVAGHSDDVQRFGL